MFPACALGIMAVLYLTSTVARDVFFGAPTSLAVSAIEPTCRAAIDTNDCASTDAGLSAGQRGVRVVVRRAQ
jgi:hypothetical protein